MSDIIPHRPPPAPDLPDFGVSLRDFDVMCKEAGFISFSGKSLAASAAVGAGIKKLGAVKIGRSRLLISDEQMDRTFQWCEQLLANKPVTNAVGDVCVYEDDPPDPEGSFENKIEVLKVMAQISRARSANATRLIESAKVDMSDGSKPSGIAASFMPGQKVVPNAAVQINIGTNNDLPKPGQREQP